jgi:hypothetical protein
VAAHRACIRPPAQPVTPAPGRQSRVIAGAASDDRIWYSCRAVIIARPVGRKKHARTVGMARTESLRRTAVAKALGSPPLRPGPRAVSSASLRPRSLRLAQAAAAVGPFLDRRRIPTGPGPCRLVGARGADSHVGEPRRAGLPPALGVRQVVIREPCFPTVTSTASVPRHAATPSCNIALWPTCFRVSLAYCVPPFVPAPTRWSCRDDA